MENGERVEGVTLQSIWKFLVGVAGVATVIFLLWYFSDVVVYILISAVLAIMSRSLVNKIEGLKVGRHNLSRGVAAMLTLFVLWAIFAILISIFLPLIFTKLYQLTNIDLQSVLKSIEEPILYLQHHIQGLLSLPESNLSLSDTLMSLGREHIDLNSLNTIFTSFVGMAASSVISFFSISFITFFFLKDENLFFNMVSAIFPSAYSENVERAITSVSYLLSRYFVGLFCESAIIATAVSVAMICFGMPMHDAFFMGLVMGVMNVIPCAGPFIGICTCTFLGIASPIESLGVGGTVLAIIVSFAIIKGLDDFMLQPTLYSERVKAHPLEIFIVILMSGYVAGVVGMLLAIPSYTVLRVFAKEFFSQYSLVQKLTKEL